MWFRLLEFHFSSMPTFSAILKFKELMPPALVFELRSISWDTSEHNPTSISKAWFECKTLSEAKLKSSLSRQYSIDVDWEYRLNICRFNLYLSIFLYHIKVHPRLSSSLERTRTHSFRVWNRLYSILRSFLF